MEAKLRKGDILHSHNGLKIEVLSNDSYRYLKTPCYSVTSEEITSLGICDWDFRLARWSLDTTSVVDRILVKYNSL